MGPRNGYSTPTNVFAQTGDATSEQHKASAIERFFTCAIPQRWQGRNEKLVCRPKSAGPDRTESLDNYSPFTRSRRAFTPQMWRACDANEEVNEASTAQFGFKWTRAGTIVEIVSK